MKSEADSLRKSDVYQKTDTLIILSGTRKNKNSPDVFVVNIVHNIYTKQSQFVRFPPV